ncbi:Fibronectin type III domain-containing protein 11 [Channa argus]|uniref:Fibronectin type III domain-containing protein 11 n=1 Tax=Channa argus TaxID=215402 RepID=A0A6G1PGR7_CHAAH|nr:Fibronectin type III domain-containing protein 11 [Channa argus]KAK2914567.1 hypothetical protein Q8A73_005161 [Channa argus]
MDKVNLPCTSSDECGVQEIRNDGATLPVLQHQIQLLLSSRLSDNSLMAMQKKLQLMQRSSYYLEIQCENLPPAAHLHQHTMNLSECTVWSLLDHQRLQEAITLANTHVKLLLKVLEMLYQEILSSGQELKAFAVKHEGSVADCETTAFMQQKLQQIQQHVNDFYMRPTRNLDTLKLQNQLIPIMDHHYHPPLQFTASLVIKMPVVFNRSESRASSNSVHLCWEVVDELSKDPNEEFVIHIKNLYTNTDELEQFSKSTYQYSIQVNNLISDTLYQFSVKRVDRVNLVFGMWTDTIIMKTLAGSK